MKSLYIAFIYLSLFSNTVYATKWERIAGGRSGFGENDTIAISPHNPNMLYFTDADLLYQSKDGGEQWEQVETETVEGTINDIVINPQNTAIIYLTTVDDSTFTARVFKSEDNGISWIKKLESKSERIQLRINPYNTDIIYLFAYSFSASFFKSIDGGDNWESPTSSVFAPSFLAVDPQNPNTLYQSTTSTLFSGGPLADGLYKSIDQGQTWVLKTGLYSYPSYTKLPIAINPHHPNTLYVSEPYIYSYESPISARVRKSIDGGETWEVIHNIATDNIVIDPHNPEIVYLGARTGLYRSANGGKTWTELSVGVFSEPNIRALVINPHHPEILFVGVQDSGLYRVITDSDCVATYNSTQNVVDIPCLRIDNDSSVLDIELTGRESDLLFDVSGVQAR
ncbi:WD40/YVTN/BNR-like repeat-containing protein [Beggiatoa leptomitoformis]|uniref:Sortilin N-terminal domain-containing protein n=1 Tax=Beggiatoa leptomitoformis TaxID=288004 RepID=A0A2N9YCK2_9GAMM|nr:sialidase family protein [Beggiatoa leptomitoformis]ALG66545.1 hypothetical protein AL038_00830 [Beggiatoa leptomitoformis]AUI68156.1 hypothetical protein BLE401_05215 [Beggiatoa leptomitoformis]